MAGRGPAPKDPNRRARGKRGETQTILRFTPAPQPALPDGFPWPDRTRDWWAKWGRAPQSEMFSETDWEFLADTALLHATAWASAERAVDSGERIDTSQHAELRIRVAKFGATIEDRARLRIVFADADERDARRVEGEPASAKWGELRVLPQSS